MKETLETTASPSAVWAAWEKAHAKKSPDGFRYRVVDLVEGSRFTVEWRAFFVRLLFHHSVSPHRRGALLTYEMEFKGLFGWLARFFLANKIRRNLRAVLKSFIQQLESQNLLYGDRFKEAL